MDKLEALRILGFKYLTKDIEDGNEETNEYVIAWKVKPELDDTGEVYLSDGDIRWVYSEDFDCDSFGNLLHVDIEDFKFMIGRESELVVIDDEIAANQRYNFEREYFCVWEKRK